MRNGSAFLRGLRHRVAELEPRVDELADAELGKLENAGRRAHGQYTTASMQLRDKIRARRTELAAATDAAAAEASDAAAHDHAAGPAGDHDTPTHAIAEHGSDTVAEPAGDRDDQWASHGGRRERRQDALYLPRPRSVGLPPTPREHPCANAPTSPTTNAPNGAASNNSSPNKPPRSCAQAPAGSAG